MASPTTLNIGEPADEISGDGSSVPLINNTITINTDDAYEETKEAKNDGFDEFSHTDEQEIEDMIRYNFFRECGKDDSAGDGVQRDLTSENSEVAVNELSGIFSSCRIGKDDILFNWIPAIGTASYCYFSFISIDPEWLATSSFINTEPFLSLMWSNALGGAGLHIYSKKNIWKASYPRKILYSISGSLLFNLGSLAMWGLVKTVLPEIRYVRFVVSAAASFGMVYLGRDFLNHVDSLSSEVD